MQEIGQERVNEIIYKILSEGVEDFSQTQETTYAETEETPIENPTIATLNSIRNICDNIQNSIINTNSTDEQFLMMELMEIENKLRDCNDNLSALQNFTNNQPRILTGDIILSAS